MTFYVSNNISLRHNNLFNDKLLDVIIYEYNNISDVDIVVEDMGFLKVTNSVSLKIYSKYNVSLKKRDNLI